MLVDNNSFLHFEYYRIIHFSFVYYSNLIFSLYCTVFQIQFYCASIYQQHLYDIKPNLTFSFLYLIIAIYLLQLFDLCVRIMVNLLRTYDRVILLGISIIFILIYV